MAMWRCPHCSTPQAVTARCWVCKRSSTSCGTCRNFRRSVAPGIGYCGLDRRRAPLLGSEIRPCWEEAPVLVATATAASPRTPRTDEPVPGRRRRLEFVPVDGAPDRAGADGPAAGPATTTPTAADTLEARPADEDATGPRTFGLWDEPEPGTDRPTLGA